jgi:UDP-N-acetylglucosamine/UDP-N-acetylgalactosamine 4-epimerase
MSKKYLDLKNQLHLQPRTWLVTGAAGFIGSHLVEALLNLGQTVIGLDDFSTGHRSNLLDVECSVSPGSGANFRFIKGDIRDKDICAAACQGVDHVLHQAALGSVPRSLAQPMLSHEVNITGFLQMLMAARDAGVKSFVYAASSSTYGDDPELPKREQSIGRPLSPYAVTKYVNELYAEVFARNYGMTCVGLRYFNVFGPRQDPHGAYAAVIPLWIKSMLMGEDVTIFGDGLTTRDFCHVHNAVQANLLAAVHATAASAEVYNVAGGASVNLLELFEATRQSIMGVGCAVKQARPLMRDFREADVRHSVADISKAADKLGFEPEHTFASGLRQCIPWYKNRLLGQGNGSSPEGSTCGA